MKGNRNTLTMAALLATGITVFAMFSACSKAGNVSDTETSAVAETTAAETTAPDSLREEDGTIYESAGTESGRKETGDESTEAKDAETSSDGSESRQETERVETLGRHTKGEVEVGEDGEVLKAYFIDAEGNEFAAVISDTTTLPADGIHIDKVYSVIHSQTEDGEGVFPEVFAIGDADDVPDDFPQTE